MEKFAINEENSALSKIRVRFDTRYSDEVYEGLELLMLYDREWDARNLQEGDC
jgi:hypothetical protein